MAVSHEFSELVSDCQLFPAFLDTLHGSVCDTHIQHCGNNVKFTSKIMNFGVNSGPVSLVIE
jgi:hypothetical protein